MPHLASSDQQILECFDVMSELRPHLVKDEFLATVKRMQDEGYQMAYVAEKGEVVAVAGFHISYNLYLGKHCYVDDLSTAEVHRSKGYGEQLVKWLEQHALEQKCVAIELDSGTHRGRAHKFYFKQDFHISSYHFAKTLKP